ncbi:MAG: HPF/RaiA family ribosome-associated protein [Phycisphaerales bacterium]|nr:HPF/RaiA family ribosome-associated protein [Phycisphaerales bacterium]
MVITLVDGSIKTTDSMRDFVNQRIGAALDRFRDRISRIEVRITDENGPRGGIDKMCRVTAMLAGQGPLMVEKRAGDFYEAIARATNAVKQSVARRVSKRGQR